MKTRHILSIALTALAVGGVAYWSLRDTPKPVPTELTYTGSEKCASCHKAAFDNWQQSDHRHAMEVADGKSVLGNFQDAVFEYGGIKTRFFIRDGKYFVETDNASGSMETFRVGYTFGRDPLQQYLIALPDGRLQALSIVWDTRPAAEGGQRWYHLYPNERVTHEDPLHWTGAFQNWNSRCASCHSTGVVKNYSRETNLYDTKWQEINVGCEACHGPGSRHVAWADGATSLENKGLVTQVGKVWEPTGGKRPTIPAADFSMSGQLQVCSGCHSGRLELQQPYVGASYFDNYSLGPLVEDRYHADGQIRKEEVYETGSFLQSRMHENHVSCSNCHEPHSARLKMTGNALCLQCHEQQRFQSRDHFFHEPESAGAQCINCHMPQQTYMVIDVRRDHSFRVPYPAASVKLGVPNACTQCHKNRNDRWAADYLAKRAGGPSEPRYPHAALLAGARKNDRSVAAGLLAYARNPGNAPILRSIAVLESARFPSEEQLAAVNAAVTSGDPLVRMGAASALGKVDDPKERLSRLQPLLGDPVKSVRMMVARQLIDVPLAEAPAEVRGALTKLFEEYRASLLYNADMPESMNDLGLFLSAQGDAAGAEQAVLQASKLAPRYLPAMLNLSDLYRAQNRDDMGERVLKVAVEEYPKSGDARHALGLLYVRTNRTREAMALLEQASRLAPDNAQYALVYAVALIENGSRAEGIRVLETAARRFPENGPVRQALESFRSQ